MGKRTPKTPKPAKTPATAPATPAASQFNVGDLVEFYCPSTGTRQQEKVAGFVPEQNWVTLESGRHFPAAELVTVPQA